MSLQPKLVPVVFEGGLSQKIDPKLTIPGKFLTLVNAIRNKMGRWDKRHGYDQLSNSTSTSTISGAIALAVFDADLTLLTDKKLYSWSPASSKWFEKSDITSVSATTKQFLRNSYEQSVISSEVNLGIRVTAYQDTRGGVYAAVTEESSGAFLTSETQLHATAVKPKVIKCGQYLFVYYLVGAHLRVRRLDPQNPLTFDTEVSLATDLHASDTRYDVVNVGTHMAFAYNTTTPSLKVGYVTQVPAVASPTTGAPSPVTSSDAPSNCVTIHFGNNALWIGYHNGTNGTRVIAYNLDLSIRVAAATLEATTSPITQNITAVYNSTTAKVHFIYEVNAAAASNTFIKTATITTGGTIVTGTVLLRSVGLASKAFVYSGRVYVASVHDSSLQATHFLVRDDGFAVSKFTALNAGGLKTERQLSDIVAASDSVSTFSIMAQTKSQLISENSQLYTLKGIAKVSFDFSSDDAFHSAQLAGGNLHIAAGVLQSYDGFSAVEHGFHLFPEGATSAVQATGSIDVGTGSHVVVYTWVDNQGLIHRSAPSLPIAFTTTVGNQKVVVTIPTLRITAKKTSRTPVIIEVYRNEVPGGTVYYKVSSSASPLYNDPTVDTVSFTDTAASSTILSNEILYTTGNILDHISPPSCKLVSLFKGRIVLAGLEDRRTFWISKLSGKGEGVGFSDALEFIADIDITAQGVLDDKLVFFSTSQIRYVTGSGPNNAGQNSDLSEPTSIPTDVGCPYPNSVVSTPDGLMFKSQKGIYLLDSSLKPSYIGADVEDYNSLTIESAVLLEDDNQVRFATAEGTVLVYNYLFKEWSVFENLSAYDAVNWQGTYMILRPTSYVWQENDTYADNGSHIPLKLGSSWLQAAGLMGFQRIYSILLLGDYRSSHTLRVKIAYDFENHFEETYYFDADEALQIDENLFGVQTPFGTGIFGGSGSSVYQLICKLKRQKCQSVRFEIEDIATSSPGEAYSIAGAAFNVGVKRGTHKLPSAKVI